MNSLNGEFFFKKINGLAIISHSESIIGPLFWTKAIWKSCRPMKPSDTVIHWIKIFLGHVNFGIKLGEKHNVLKKDTKIDETRHFPTKNLEGL